VASADLGLPVQLSQGLTGGNGNVDVTGFPDASPDASRAFFSTAEPLVAGDTDSKVDVYERSAGTTTLVSVGPDGGNGPFDVNFDEFTETGDHALFETRESLVTTDTDTANDIYDRSGGTTTLISAGAINGNAVCQRRAPGQHRHGHARRPLPANRRDHRPDLDRSDRRKHGSHPDAVRWQLARRLKALS
jgi:hypothetical protein